MHHIEFSAAQQVRRVTWVGFFVNLGLTVFKCVAGILGSSQAVLADGIHSLSDSMTDLVVIVGSHYWSRPPDAEHPYGHRRLETFVTILIGLVLFGAGVGIAWEALQSIRHPAHTIPGWIAVLAAAVSVVVNELLYRWTARWGREVKSSAVLANAWHHRLDAVSSIPAFLAVAGAILLPSWTLLDTLGAFLVALIIIQAATRIVWPGLKELMDWGAPQELCNAILAIAETQPGIRNVHKIRTRYQSGSIFADMHVVVDGDISVLQGHDIAEHVRNAVMKNLDEVVDVVVHVDPYQVEPVSVDEVC